MSLAGRALQQRLVDENVAVQAEEARALGTHDGAVLQVQRDLAAAALEDLAVPQDLRGLGLVVFCYEFVVGRLLYRVAKERVHLQKCGDCLLTDGPQQFRARHQKCGTNSALGAKFARGGLAGAAEVELGS